MQRLPPVPHAANDGGMHVEPEQHPEAQVSGPQVHTPFMHSSSGPHGAPVPH
jgi:hypothetical protein